MTIFPFSQKQLYRCLGNACERWDMDELYISVFCIIVPEKCISLWISLPKYTTHLTRSILGTIQEDCPQSLYKKKGYMTEWIRTMFPAINATRIGSIKTLILSSPAAQNMIYVINWSRVAWKLTNCKNFWICPSLFHGTPTYTFRNS